MTAFSNHTMFDIWAGRWCYRCTKDGIGTTGDEPFCPILSAVMATNTVPPEWTETDAVLGDYACSEFEERRDDDGDDPGGDPRPDPAPAWDAEMPGQITILDEFVDRIVDEATTAPDRTKVNA